MAWIKLGCAVSLMGRLRYDELDAGYVLWYDFDMAKMASVLLSRTYNRHCGRLLSLPIQHLDHGGGFVFNLERIDG